MTFNLTEKITLWTIAICFWLLAISGTAWSVVSIFIEMRRLLS